MPSTGVEARLAGHDIDKIRLDFIKLYQFENKKLEEIIPIFEAKGIYASKQQWKTQITLWDIGKYNRESDMVFAAQKATKRKRVHDKETAFLIKGQFRNVKDVNRYFKRCRTSADEFPVVASTPEGIIYYTPVNSPHALPGSPRSLRSSTTRPSSTALLETTHLENGKAITNSNDKKPVQFIRSSTQFPDVMLNEPFFRHDTRSPPSVLFEYTRTRVSLSPLLPAPDKFRNIEMGLFAIKQFYTSVLHSLGDEQAFEQSNGQGSALLVEVHSTVVHHMSGRHSTAQIFWQAALTRLPTVLKQGNGVCFAVVTEIFAVLYLKYPGRYLYRLLLKHFSHLTTENLGTAHPFTKIIEALVLNFDDLLECLQQYLKQAADALSSHLPRGISHWFGIINGQRYLSKTLGDWHSCITQSEEIDRVLGLVHPQSEDILQAKFVCQLARARSYMELHDFPQCQRILQNALEFASYKPLTLYPHLYYVYLGMRGELRVRTGDTGGVDDVRKAWLIALQSYGAESGITCVAARLLQDVTTGGRQN